MPSSASISLPSIMSLRDAIALLRRFGRNPARACTDAPLDLRAEMAQETLYGPGGAFAEGADRVSLDLFANFLQQIDFGDFRVAALHARQHAPHPAATFPARRALSAALVPVEIGEPRKCLDDVGRF